MSGAKRRIVWLYPKIEKPMGGTNFVLYAGAELQRDYEVVVIAQKTAPTLARKCRELSIELIDLSLPTFTDPFYWLSQPYQMARLRKLIARHLRPHDIVISSMYPMHVAVAALGRNDLQIVYEPFAFFYDKAYLQSFGLLHMVFFNLMRRLFGNEDRAATRSARRLLTLSQFEQRRIEAVYGCKADIVYEGVDTQMFFPSEPPPDADLDSKIIVLHSTGFDRYKGTDTVISAVPELVRRVSNLLLLVTYTRDAPAILQNYKRFLEAHSVSENVRFLGAVPYSELPTLYRRARVYVEPGKDRSMSLSVKEAMACGTSVVRGMEGYEEISDGVEGFLVAAHDVEKFVDCVVRICFDDELRKRQSEAALARVREQFTWRAVANRIKRTVESLS